MVQISALEYKYYITLHNQIICQFLINGDRRASHL